MRWVHTNKHHSSENKIREWISSLEQPCNFYDLGACTGWFSLYAAKLGIKTYSFEVNPHNFRGLRENVEANKNILKNIDIFNVGIADKPGRLKLRYEYITPGEHLSTLEIDNFGNLSDTISEKNVELVDVDSLDNIVKKNNLPFPDHLKVDIDGSENAFLEGSPLSLMSARTLVIEAPNVLDIKKAIKKALNPKLNKLIDKGLVEFTVHWGQKGSSDMGSSQRQYMISDLFRILEVWKKSEKIILSYGFKLEEEEKIPKEIFLNRLYRKT